MRTVIFAIVLILIIVVGWAISANIIEDQTNNLNDDLDEVILNIEKENWSLASESFEKVGKRWRDIRNFWSIILDHHEIDNIDLSISKAERYIASNNKALSLGEVEVLKKLFEIVKENESLTITNIL